MKYVLDQGESIQGLVPIREHIGRGPARLLHACGEDDVAFENRAVHALAPERHLEVCTF